MKKCSLWLCPLAIAAIVALDQWVKAYIVTHFAVGESAEFLPQLRASSCWRWKRTVL